jgi:hypothetical protein
VLDFVAALHTHPVDVLGRGYTFVHSVNETRNALSVKALALGVIGAHHPPEAGLDGHVTGLDFSTCQAVLHGVGSGDGLSLVKRQIIEIEA